MKIEKIKTLIRKMLTEVKSTGYVVVDLDRMRGAFDAGRNDNESPINPKTGDVNGQWEHITNWTGDEIGMRNGWETNFTVFPDRSKATMWAMQHLKGQENPVTGKPFRFQVLAYAQWGAELDRQQKSIGTSRSKEFEPFDQSPASNLREVGFDPGHADAYLVSAAKRSLGTLNPQEVIDLLVRKFSVPSSKARKAIEYARMGDEAGGEEDQMLGLKHDDRPAQFEQANVTPEKQKAFDVVEKWVKQLGARKTGIKLVDYCLQKKTGMGHEHLPDSPEFMNGLDAIEEALKAHDIQGAYNIAAETANEMLDGEGMLDEEKKEDFHDGLARELGNAKKERNPEKIAYYTQALRNPNQTAVASFDKQFKGSWAYDQWVKKSAKDIEQAAADLKRFAWLREVVNEAVSEVMREGALPAGIPANHIMSVEEFMKDAETGVNEADMLGAKTTAMSPDDMQKFLGQTKGKTLAPADKYKMPYVHGSNIEIRNDAGQKYDTEKLKAAIVRRPTQILKKNEKMGKSAGPNTTFFNIGLPALKGLAVNEKTNEFVIVDVCPGAGACKVYCYARKGGYIQYKDASMSQTRLLNYILNDPEGFKKQFETELRKEQASAKKHGKEIVIRWHDAGDFFSPDYLTLAYSIAKDFPDVKFYAYTKMAGVAVGQKPDNFIMNFSMGATPEQEKQIDFGTTKHSTVVPKQMFDQYMQKDAKGKLVRDEKKRMQFIDDAALEEFKKKLGAKHNIKPETIITYDDLLKTPVDKELNKYNVIIRPGDGDISASRPDVKGTYLLIH
jgi:hypothetical protein